MERGGFPVTWISAAAIPKWAFFRCGSLSIWADIGHAIEMSMHRQETFEDESYLRQQRRQNVVKRHKSMAALRATRDGLFETVAAKMALTIDNGESECRTVADAAVVTVKRHQQRQKPLDDSRCWMSPPLVAPVADATPPSSYWQSTTFKWIDSSRGGVF